MKLLYITASFKPEESSCSRRAGRIFINRLLAAKPIYELEELDLSAGLPEPENNYYRGWAELVTQGPEYDVLPPEGKEAVGRMAALCEQFLEADVVVIAAPMWSLSFPSRLKQYLDCIMLNHRVIELSGKHAKGLLNDKPRQMVYIQSSGGVYPRILDGKFNFGVNYFRDLFKSLGVQHFHKILVQGTDQPEVGFQKALDAAKDDMDDALDALIL